MLIRKMFSTGLIFLLLLHAATGTADARSADTETIEVQASDTAQLQRLLEDRKVNVVLTDATRLKGKVQEVRSAEIVMDVERAEGAGALTKGTHTIPIAKVSTVKVISHKGKAKAVVPLITGGVGGLMGLGVLFGAAYEPSEQFPAYAVLAAAIPIGSIAGGYFLGKNLDKRELTVVIVR